MHHCLNAVQLLHSVREVFEVQILFQALHEFRISTTPMCFGAFFVMNVFIHHSLYAWVCAAGDCALRDPTMNLGTTIQMCAAGDCAL